MDVWLDDRGLRRLSLFGLGFVVDNVGVFSVESFKLNEE